MSKGGSETTTQKTEVDPDIKAAYLGNVGYAQDVANQQGARQFAGIDPMYQMGEQQALGAATGTGAQNLGTAAELSRAAAGYAPSQISYDQGLVDQYMNPYTNEVINASLGDLEAARQKAVQQSGQAAMQARAFGGSRQGVAEALTNKEYGTQAGSLVSNLRSQGFQQAVQRAMAQQQSNQAAGLQGAQFRLGAAQQLGGMGQQQTAGQYLGAQTAMGLGGARQQFAQQQMDAARNLGLERLGIMQSALGLQMPNMGGTTTMTAPMSSNPLAGALGGAQAGYSMFGPYGAAGGALLGMLG